MSELERLARKAHDAWPRDLTFPEVLSLLAGWEKHGGLRMPRTKAELAWLDGLRTANEALYGTESYFGRLPVPAAAVGSRGEQAQQAVNHRARAARRV